MTILCIALALNAAAQTRAVKIESPLMTEKDSTWYAEQTEAWQLPSWASCWASGPTADSLPTRPKVIGQPMANDQIRYGLLVRN